MNLNIGVLLYQCDCKNEQTKLRTQIRNVRQPIVLGSKPDEHGPQAAIAAGCCDVSPMKKGGRSIAKRRLRGWDVEQESGT